MEGIAPIHQFILALKFGVQSGHSARESFKIALEQLKSSKFKQEIASWYMKSQNSEKVSEVPISFRTPIRSHLLTILKMGFVGLPIIDQLEELELQVQQQCLSQLEYEFKILPYKALPGLLLFIFPAILILLLGPILTKLIEGVGA